MKRFLHCVAVMVALGLAACGGTEEPADDSNVTITKAQARSMDGKSDGVDLCDFLGWYGDGICDDFCPDPDPDCAAACTDDADCAVDQACVNGVCETGSPDPDDDHCGGFAGFTCDAGEWCDYPDDSFCGAADQLGICQPQPDDCAQVYDPVCGCDGETYSNACTAHSAGVDAAAEGPCQDPDACTVDSDCPIDQACVNGACEDANICTNDADCAVGQACVNGACEDANACTNDADCAVGQACVNGACEPGPGGGDCGGFAGFTCQDDEWCDYPDGSTCGAADQLGSCQPRPDACAQVYDPVCGCDGQTYSNGCMANAAGVDIVGSGSCS